MASTNNIGKITQVTGAVVDVQFEGELPAILNAVHAQNEGRTLVLITHRPSLLALVDRVILMTRGRIVMDGEPEQLTRRVQQVAAA